MDLLHVRELARCADDAPEEFQRCRHLGGCRQMIDQLGRDPWVAEVFLDLGGVVGVKLLRALGAEAVGSREQTGSGNSGERQPAVERQAGDRAS